MKTYGIIMELNPFHTGHEYFIKKVKKIAKDNYVIAIISTSLVQRGEISVLNQNIKTNELLKLGVDLVIALPSVLINQGGEYFAEAAIKILNHYKIDTLVFGSETNDRELLNKIVSEQLEINNNKIEKIEIKNQEYNFQEGYLKEELKDLKSNDILGISYLKGIKKVNPNISFELVKRMNNNYNDELLKKDFSSATAIRKQYNEIYSNKITKEIKKNSNEYQNALEIMKLSKYVSKDVLDNLYLINEQKLFELLKYQLLNLKEEEKRVIFLSENGQLVRKIEKNIRNNSIEDISELSEKCKDKNNSKYKFQRICLNIIFNIKEEEVENIKNFIDKEECKFYILGFSKRYQKELKKLNNSFYSFKEKNLLYEYDDKINKIINEFLITNSDLKINNYTKPIIF